MSEQRVGAGDASTGGWTHRTAEATLHDSRTSPMGAIDAVVATVDFWLRPHRRIAILRDSDGQALIEVDAGATWARVRDHVLDAVRHEGGLIGDEARAAFLMGLGIPARVSREHRLIREAPEGGDHHEDTATVLDKDDLPVTVRSGTQTVTWLYSVAVVGAVRRPRAMSGKGRPWSRVEWLTWSGTEDILRMQLPVAINDAEFERAALTASRRAPVPDLHVWWRGPSGDIELVAGSTSTIELPPEADPGAMPFDRGGTVFADLYGSPTLLREATHRINREAVAAAMPLPQLTLNAALRPVSRQRGELHS